MRHVALGVLAVVILVGTWLALSPTALLTVTSRTERGLSGVAPHELTVDDHQVVYLRGGEGPTMLWVHGFNADKDSWTRLAREVSGFDIIAPDLPGWGQSSHLEDASYDVGRQVDRLARFHTALGLGRVHIAGSSMGGHIAAVFAARHPALVATLTLIAPGGVTAPEPSDLQRDLAAGEHPLMPSTAGEYDAFLDYIFVDKPWIPGVVLDHLAAEAVAHRAATEAIWQQLGDHPLPLEPILPRIEAPTLVIWGQQDRVLHVSGAQVFQEEMEDVEVAIMEACGHAPMIERPAEVAERMVAFITSQE